MLISDVLTRQTRNVLYSLPRLYTVEFRVWLARLADNMADNILLALGYGVTSIMTGLYLYSKSEALSILQDVPKFTDLSELRQHLNGCPDKQAEVLVQGEVKMLGSGALKSEKASAEGAARLVTTTTSKMI